jgi:integrase
MASIYKRADSPYFWIKYKDEQGKVRQISTGCRIDVAPDIRRARQMEAEKSLEELKRGDSRALDRGWSWATDYLQARYKSSSLTLERYVCAWTSVTLFLQERKIESPFQLQREHCFAYIAWRQKPDKSKGKYRACHNTALMELKALRIIMDEAVNRGQAQGNPCLRLGVKKERVREKPELSDADCEKIRSEIPNVADPAKQEMLANSFEIARFQGCRLSETQLNPIADVDTKGMTITFRIKGGKDHTAPLHPALLPLFDRLRAEGKTSTWTKPPKISSRQWASATWWKFLDDIGLKAKGITFHGTRVTVISEMARADIHESKAMAYVGHAGPTVHRIYQRLRPADLKDCTSAVGAGKPPSSSTPGDPAST